MNNLIVLGLFTVVLVSLVGGLFPNRPQPPQVIYVQAPNREPISGNGCLPLILLLVVVLLAIGLG